MVMLHSVNMLVSCAPKFLLQFSESYLKWSFGSLTAIQGWSNMCWIYAVSKTGGGRGILGLASK